MARLMDSAAKRPRISVDVSPELRGRLQRAAARRDLTVRHYLMDIIEARLPAGLDEDDGGSVLTAHTDPVLAELWDNPYDAI